MQVNKSIGEIGISLNIKKKAVDILLRPSFYAFNSIGSIVDIDETIRKCFKLIDVNFVSKYDLLPCLHVIFSCMSDCDKDKYFYALFGEFKLKKDNFFYENAKISVREIIIIANHLIKWGVIGNPKQKPKKSKEKNLFDPSEYVGSAMAHLGLSNKNAWNLTMTEFQRAIESKYPPDPKNSVIPQDRLEELERRAKEAHKKLNPNRISNQAKNARIKNRR